MNKKAQNQIVEWGATAIALLILLFVFFQVGKALCGVDKTFCGYVGALIAAFCAGIYFYLRYGSRR